MSKPRVMTYTCGCVACQAANERVAHLQRPYCSCGRAWPCPEAEAAAPEDGLREALEAIRDMWAGMILVRENGEPIPVETIRVELLNDLDHAFAALPAAPEEGLAEALRLREAERLLRALLSAPTDLFERDQDYNRRLRLDVIDFLGDPDDQDAMAHTRAALAAEEGAG